MDLGTVGRRWAVLFCLLMVTWSLSRDWTMLFTPKNVPRMTGARQ